MGLIDTLGAALANWTTAPIADPPKNALLAPSIAPGSAEWDAFTGGSLGYAAPALAERQALTVSAIYGCVNLIAGAVSGLTLPQFKRVADQPPVKVDPDALDAIFNLQMCPRWSAPSGWEYIIQSLLLPGDAYVRILRDLAGTVTGLEPLRHTRVTPMITLDGSRLVYAVGPDPYLSATAKQLVLDQDDMLHIPGFGFDGLRGMSPLRYALRVAGTVAAATQDYAAEFFANSARGDYYISSDQDVDAPAFERMQEQLREAHGQRGQRHLPMILTSGLKVQALTLPFEDMQMLATRQFQVEEICRIYGVPPFMVGHNEKTTSWGSGVEAMGTGFVRYALRQHLTKIECEINRKIFRSRRRFVAFDTHELERADMATQYAALRIGAGRAGEGGFLTPNEVRAVLRYPSRDDGDALAVPKAGPAPATDPASGDPAAPPKP
jgi:HK97 family phage portal protein